MWGFILWRSWSFCEVLERRDFRAVSGTPREALQAQARLEELPLGPWQQQIEGLGSHEILAPGASMPQSTAFFLEAGHFESQLDWYSCQAFQCRRFISFRSSFRKKQSQLITHWSQMSNLSLHECTCNTNESKRIQKTCSLFLWVSSLSTFCVQVRSRRAFGHCARISALSWKIENGSPRAFEDGHNGDAVLWWGRWFTTP